MFPFERTSQTSQEHPPPPVYNAKEFTPNHVKYATAIQRRRELPPGRALPEWFAEHSEQLSNSPTDRERNGIIAVAMLQAFRDDPSLWRDCGALNSWDPTENEAFKQYLDSWSRHLSERGGSERDPEVVRRLLGLVAPQTSVPMPVAAHSTAPTG